VDERDLSISETVLGEAHFFEDDAGARHDFDLDPYVIAGRIKKLGRPAGSACPPDLTSTSCSPPSMLAYTGKRPGLGI
jgi:hypothetical protein